MTDIRCVLKYLALLAPAALTGCDPAGIQANISEPVTVITPGSPVKIDGNTVPVSGFDECPEGAGLAGPNVTGHAKNCIVLSKGRTVVDVTLYFPDRTVTETWQIIRETDRTGKDTVRLRRPGGEFIGRGY